MRPADPALRRGRRTRGAAQPPPEPVEAASRAAHLLQGPGLAAYAFAAEVVEAFTILPVMTAGQLGRLCGVSWRTLQNYAGELGLIEHIPLILPEVDGLGIESSRTATRLYRLGTVGRKTALHLGWAWSPPDDGLQPARLALDLVLAELLLRLSAAGRAAGWEAEWLPHPGGARLTFSRDGLRREYAAAACPDQPEPPGPGPADGWLLCCRAPTRPFELAQGEGGPLLALTLTELLAAGPESPPRWLDLRAGTRVELLDGGGPLPLRPEPTPAAPDAAELPAKPRRGDQRVLEMIENQRLNSNLREVVNLPERYRRFFNYMRGAVVFTFAADPALPPRIEYLASSDALLAGPPGRRKGLNACLAACDPHKQVVVWFVHPALGRQRAGLVNRETFLSRFEPAEEL